MDTLALVIGRFQMPHNMHVELIRRAAQKATRVLVVIGSVQEQGTLRNPFSGKFRMSMLQAACANIANIHFSSLLDLTHEDDHSNAWGQYLLDHVNEEITRMPGQPVLKYMVYGDDEGRAHWFSPEAIEGVEMVVVPRSEVNVSATMLRKMLVNNDFREWASYTPKSLHPMYEKIRMELMRAEPYGSMVPVKESQFINIYSRRVPTGQYRHFAHNPWCNGIGVGVLPYRTMNGSVEFLGRYEICAAHGDDAKLGLIVGGFDNMDTLSMEGCVLNELLEEGGIASSEESLVFLGKVRPNKGSDTVEYLFAVDVSGLTQGELSGTDAQDSFTKWITPEELLVSDDAQLLCAYLYGTKKGLF